MGGMGVVWRASLPSFIERFLLMPNPTGKSVRTQAQLPSYPANRTLLEMIAGYMIDGRVSPPMVLTASGEALPEAPGDLLRFIQNVGTVPIFVLFSNSGNATAGNYHVILPGGAAEFDGTGGQMQVLIPSRVSVYGTAGMKLSVLRVTGEQKG